MKPKVTPLDVIEKSYHHDVHDIARITSGYIHQLSTVIADQQAQIDALSAAINELKQGTPRNIALLTTNEHDEQTHVSVPICELRKLEEVRIKLIEMLDNSKVASSELFNIINVTSQLWRVANCKKWN